MEIIQTLRSNTTAETAQQLFKTLSETSAVVTKANAATANDQEGSEEQHDTKLSID